MINRLYSNVFHQQNPPFNPGVNCYLVLLDFLKNRDISERLMQSVERYIDKTCFDTISTTENLPGVLNSHIHQRDDNLGAAVKANYLMLFDVNEETVRNVPRDIADILNVFNSYNFLRPGETIALVVIVPETLPNLAEFFESLEKLLPDFVHLHLFINKRFEEERIINGMTGVMALYSRKDLFGYFTGNLNDTKKHVNMNITQLPTEGRQAFEQRKKLTWSVTNVVFSDDRIDFLKGYVSSLFKNVKRTDSWCNFALMTECYKELVANTGSDAPLIIKLLQAIKRIPTSVQNIKYTQACLRDFFDDIYGIQGTELVNLTLKLNLRTRNTYSKNSIRDTANRVFEEFGFYDSENILQDVLDAIQKYIDSELSDYIKKSRTDLERELSEDSSDLDSDLRDYIKAYLEYHDNIAKKLFWNDVMTYIIKNKDEFDRHCTLSRELNKQYENVMQSMWLFGGGAQYNTPQYPAAVLVNLCDNVEVCAEIKAAYETYRSMKTGNTLTGVHIQHSPIITANGIFFRDYQKTINQSGIGMVFVQRMGVYYTFNTANRGGEV